MTLGHGSPSHKPSGSSRTTHERQEDEESPKLALTFPSRTTTVYGNRGPGVRFARPSIINVASTVVRDVPQQVKTHPTGNQRDPTVPYPCERSSQEGSPNLVVSALLPRLSATTSCTRRGNQHPRSAEPSGPQTTRTVECPPSDKLRVNRSSLPSPSTGWIRWTHPKPFLPSDGHQDQCESGTSTACAEITESQQVSNTHRNQHQVDGERHNDELQEQQDKIRTSIPPRKTKLEQESDGDAATNFQNTACTTDPPCALPKLLSRSSVHKRVQTRKLH